jgi:hypothetical protein
MGGSISTDLNRSPAGTRRSCMIAAAVQAGICGRPIKAMTDLLQALRLQ